MCDFFSRKYMLRNTQYTHYAIFKIISRQIMRIEVKKYLGNNLKYLFI